MNVNVDYNGFDNQAKPTTNAASLEVGTAFLGTVPDVNGDDQTGLFLRTTEGLIMLDDMEAEFDSFSAGDTYYAPEITNYREADITVVVDDVQG